MTVARYLIVNADDFGRSEGVNRGIIRAHQHGIVTSASLMVRWPAAAAAAVFSREHAELSLGLHIDLGEWSYRQGTWVPVYEVIPPDDPAAMRDEVALQLDSFRRLAGRDPTHIDSHQHVHREEPARSALFETARKLGVPLRDCAPGVRYCGSFYGQTAKQLSIEEAVSVEALLAIVTSLPAGVTELGCHPGEGGDLDSAYRWERLLEARALCDPRVRAAIEAMGIALRSFHDLPDR